MDRLVEVSLVLVLIAIVAIGVLAVYGAKQDRDACIASGRDYVVDHYDHRLIMIGKVLMPQDVPVYKCVEH